MNPVLEPALAARTRYPRDKVSLEASVGGTRLVKRDAATITHDPGTRLVYPVVFSDLPGRLTGYGKLPQYKPVASVHTAAAVEVAVGGAEYAILPDIYEAFDELHQNNGLLFADLDEDDPLRCQLGLWVRDAVFQRADAVQTAVVAVLTNRPRKLGSTIPAKHRERPPAT